MNCGVALVHLSVSLVAGECVFVVCGDVYLIVHLIVYNTGSVCVTLQVPIPSSVSHWVDP